MGSSTKMKDEQMNNSHTEIAKYAIQKFLDNLTLDQISDLVEEHPESAGLSERDYVRIFTEIDEMCTYGAWATSPKERAAFFASIS